MIVRLSVKDVPISCIWLDILGCQPCIKSGRPVHWEELQPPEGRWEMCSRLKGNRMSMFAGHRSC